jgi:DNA-binding transcriptional MerR regulator
MAAEKRMPDKLYYRIGEVCALTDTQPYVLRFWESEFPQLAPQKNRSGQRIYRRQDIDIVERIKHLLHDEGYTIAGARKRLEQELHGEAPEPRPAAADPDAGSGGQRPEARPAPAATAGEGGAAARLREAVRELREILAEMRRLDDRLGRLP